MKIIIKIAIIGPILLFCLFLIYYFHFIIKTELVFTHLFYIPIIISAIWWKRTAIFVAIFLGIALILPELLIGKGLLYTDLLRALMFIFVASVASYVMLQNKKYLLKIEENEKLKESTNIITSQAAEIKAQNEEYQQINEELTQTNEQLRLTSQKVVDSETKFKTFADFTYDWEFWSSPENVILYTSPSCERVTGYTPESFTNITDLLSQIIHKEDLTLFQKHNCFVHECKTVDEIDFRITTRSGKVRWIHHICQPVYDEKGNYMGIRGSNRDITERKHSELIIIRQNIELQKLNADKDRFMSILGHDLRSPFNSMLGFSELLYKNLRNYDIDKIESFVYNIYKTTLNSYHLLDDILLWANSQMGKMTYDPHNLNLKNICIEILDVFKINAENKNITIKYFSTDEFNVFADENMLKIILRNLISNAIKFTNVGGKIDIYAVQNSEIVTVTISDNGIGISPENLHKLFDISQIYTTSGTNKEKGTGLGLFLCNEFIEKHNGKIWVESEEGKGSKFNFTLSGPKN